MRNHREDFPDWKRNFMEYDAFEDTIYHLLNRGVSRKRLQGETLLNLQ